MSEVNRSGGADGYQVIPMPGDPDVDPLYRRGDRVRHIKGADRFGEGTIVYYTTRPNHPVGGWWYSVEWDDARVNEATRGSLFSERVLNKGGVSSS